MQKVSNFHLGFWYFVWILFSFLVDMFRMCFKFIYFLDKAALDIPNK